MDRRLASESGFSRSQVKVGVLNFLTLESESPAKSEDSGALHNVIKQKFIICLGLT